MYAVIFKAKAGKQDEKYSKTVARMRELAFDKYGCLEFIAASDGEQEITISYWKDEQSIKNWKNDSEHLLAQDYGRANWYKSYSVQIVEIKREYSHKC
ncbi:MAG: antibiotic biosynthesis monooxygenase [Gammaproteobacteria bacterium]|nr:MAG: antibiotic biosynthesis monooxygenase [Gammaproteobacteria bacterium]